MTESPYRGALEDPSLAEAVVQSFTGDSAQAWSSGLEWLTGVLGGRAAILGLEGEDELPLALATHGPVGVVSRNSEVVAQVRKFRKEARTRTVVAFRTSEEPVVDFAMITAPNRDLLGLTLWGASEPVTKVHPLLRAVVSLLWRLLDRANQQPAEPSPRSDDPDLRFPEEYMVGTSRAIADLHRELGALARSEISLLLIGETGTGKELLARTIHLSSPRAIGPFVAINCAAIPDTLLEAELFGVERRVATGVDPREGRFEQADGGTLLLDEIGEMPPPLQAKLLRVLQEREVQPLGGRPRPIDVRVVAATNSDLRRRMAGGTFRRDLYYRIAGIELTVPPLRRRREDIPALVRRFLDRSLRESGRRIRGVSLRAMELLVGYAWPGNVRELEHLVRRLAFTCPEGEVLGSSHLRELFLQQTVEPVENVGARLEGGDFDLKEYLDGIERLILREALVQSGGNQTRAAALLGLSRNGLAKKIQRFGIDPDGVVRG